MRNMSGLSRHLPSSRRRKPRPWLAPVLAFFCCPFPCCIALHAEDLLTTSKTPGIYGGRIIVAQRSQPKTLNPVTAIDGASREVIQLLMADLVHINRASQGVEAALAQSTETSPDGRRYTLRLRRDLRFSDGHPFDADDVLFTFHVYLDEKVASPQRDLLFVGGKPLSIRKQDAHTLVFEFAEPYGPGTRLFDNIAILPRHLLSTAYQHGQLTAAWGLNTPASAIAGMGPFRLKEQVPGDRLVLERNPYYWKQDSAHHRLPYVQGIVFEYAGSQDGEVLRFQAGATDLVSRLSAKDFELLSRQPGPSRKLWDLGPGLEYNFLFFNLNDVSRRSLPEIAAKQTWFRDEKFRLAVSAAIDRQAMVSLVYAGRATPIWTQVTPGNRLWRNTLISQPPRSFSAARELLRASGFSWSANGDLRDPGGRRVEFSLVTNANNQDRVQMAALIQQDLKELGMSVRVVALEFRSLLDRIMNTWDYDTCLLGLVSGDVDPGSEMNVWLSVGGTHLWKLDEKTPATSWQAEIDRLMRAQMTSTNEAERKQLYDHVQQLVAGHVPIICLVSPNILVGADTRIGNFRATILPPYTLWNAEELFWRSPKP
jgi:peptide/nickel transport system substrate-binding protein